MEYDALQDLTPTAWHHALFPRNHGPLETFNGHARVTGPCGDTMEFWVLVVGGLIERVSFVTDGCGASQACGSMATCLAEGADVAEAACLSQRDVLRALGGLPEEVAHCARLAADTLNAACEDYLLGKTGGR